MESINLPRRSQLPSSPLTTFQETISTKPSAFLKIRHLKYIHEIEFLEKSPHLAKLRILKRLHSLIALDPTSLRVSDASFRERKRNKPKAIKIMKPLQKAVQYFCENDKQGRTKNNPLNYLIILFPYVSKYSLKINDIFSWKFLYHCPRVKKLQIQLISPSHSSSASYYNYSSSSQLTATKSNINKFTLLFKKKLTQYLLQKQCVKRLSIKISPDFKDISKVFLGWLDEIKIYLPNLKSFSLDKALNAENFLMKQDKKRSLSQEYLRYTTHLALTDVMSPQFCSPIGLEYFRNLVSLNVSLSSSESIANTDQLIHLTSLKTLDLRIYEASYRAEKIFLNKFALPPNITKLVLNLQKFIWKGVSNSKAAKKSLEEFFTSHPRFLRFAHQFKNATNLKSFTLSILDPNTRGCSKIIGLLAVAVLKQISTLETLKYYHFIAPWREKQQFVRYSKNRPLSLSYFYQGLEPSKKSLEKISIRAPQIIVSDFLNIRRKLPKLQAIHIEDHFWIDHFPDKENIIGAYNIFSLWNKKIPSAVLPPLAVDIGELAVCNEKKLKLYFNSLRSIPQDWNLTIKLNFSGVGLKTFCEEVKGFLEQVNPKNNLSLTLNYNFYRCDADKEIQEIKTAATKTSSLKCLELKSRNSVLFISRRGVIIQQK